MIYRWYITRYITIYHDISLGNYDISLIYHCKLLNWLIYQYFQIFFKLKDFFLIPPHIFVSLYGFIHVTLKIIKDQGEGPHIPGQADQHEDDGANDKHKWGSPEYGETYCILSSKGFRNNEAKQAEFEAEKYNLWISRQIRDKSDSQNRNKDNFCTLIKAQFCGIVEERQWGQQTKDRPYQRDQGRG